ncbi:LysM peptidoglycan-binding domain-containing protein, partial [Zooshikella harenae]
LRYVNNHKGQILTRTEEGHDRNDDHKAYLRTHHFYYVNGIGIGDVGDDGPTYTDYATQLAYNQGLMRKPDKTEPVFSADFDANFQAIGENYPAQSPGGYTVQQGDTLQTIALALWGDSSLWFMLADANGLQPQQLKDLKPGTFLTVPNKVTNIHNNSSTFRPYNAGVAIGDVSPTLPDMPPPPIKPAGGGCGGAAVIIAVVAIAATIFTGGAALMAMTGATSMTAAAGAATLGEAMLAGAAGAIAGDLAGQVAGMAMGVQKSIHFSRTAKAGARGAISAAVTYGIDQGLTQAAKSGSQWAATASDYIHSSTTARATVSNVANQALGTATGFQKKFDWKGVAVAAAGASMQGYASDALGIDANDSFGRYASALTEGVVREGIASKIYGRRFDFKNAAQSALTNELGSHIAGYETYDQVSGRLARQQYLARQVSKPTPSTQAAQQETAIRENHSSVAKSSGGVKSERVQGNLEQRNAVKITQKVKQQAKVAHGVTSDEVGLDYDLESEMYNPFEGKKFRLTKEEFIKNSFASLDVDPEEIMRVAEEERIRQVDEYVNNFAEENNIFINERDKQRFENRNTIEKSFNLVYKKNEEDKLFVEDMLNWFEVAVSADEQIGIEKAKSGLAFFNASKDVQQHMVSAVKNRDIESFALPFYRQRIIAKVDDWGMNRWNKGLANWSGDSVKGALEFEGAISGQLANWTFSVGKAVFIDNVGDYASASHSIHSFTKDFDFTVSVDIGMIRGDDATVLDLAEGLSKSYTSELEVRKYVSVFYEKGYTLEGETFDSQTNKSFRGYGLSFNTVDYKAGALKSVKNEWDSVLGHEKLDKLNVGANFERSENDNGNGVVIEYGRSGRRVYTMANTFFYIIDEPRRLVFDFLE